MPSGLPLPSRYNGIATGFSAFAARGGKANVPSPRHRVARIDDVRARRVPNMATVWRHASADATLAAHQAIPVRRPLAPAFLRASRSYRPLTHGRLCAD